MRMPLQRASRTHRLPAWPITAVVAFGCGMFAGAMVAGTDPNDPPSPPTDDPVLETVVEPHRLPAWRQRSAARERCRQSPDDWREALGYARVCVDAFRAEGDPRHLSHAEAALGQWWRIASPPPEVRLWRAVILQCRHRFSEARADLEALVSERPELTQGWLTLSSVLLVMGEPKEARVRSQPLRETAGEFVFAVADAGAAGLSGDAENSRQRLVALLAGPCAVPPAHRAWACGMLADICERMGRVAEAESYFRAGLVLAPDDTYCLAAWADLLLSQGRYREVVDRLATRRENHALALRWACAKARLAESDAPYVETVVALRVAERAAVARGEHGHAREEARMHLELLDDPETALGRALLNWQTQREPADARLVVACARAAGKPAAAAPVLAWRKRTGMEDVVLDSLVAELEAAP